MKKLYIYVSLITGLTFGSCQNYLDIVPDNVATIDNSFNMRVSAERFLFSCYSYLPKLSNIEKNPAFTAGDEIWLHDNYITPGWQIAQGNQNLVDPFLNYWQGTRSGDDLYQAIRDCNIFLENIGVVPDMEESERLRWIAEVKFLKAYYHFYLIRMYGPIPLKKENLPIDANPETVKVPRNTLDECFEYVVELLDESTADLPPKILNESTELGRITQPIALAVKAYILTTAASPLFNGNPDYANFKDKQGNLIFSTTYSAEKWERAKEACRLAIEAAETAGARLYYYSQSGQQYNVSPDMEIQMNIRNAVTEKWNDEIIWGHSNSMTDNMQVQATPRGLDPANRASAGARGNAGVPIKIASMFYSKNGVPIEEDKAWDYAGRFNLRQASAEEDHLIKLGYTTANLNFDREQRFYASLGFDGGIWFGQGKFNEEEAFFVSAKKGDPASNVTNSTFNATGYWAKKLVNYTNVITATGYNREQYPWPTIRLANIYLLYAETLNESNGPSSEVYQWLDLVRERAGLAGVVDSWNQHSVNPTKPLNQDGLREIIHRERLIELALEGQRYWDLRRWKKATEELNKPITGWDIEQRTPEGYYREKVLFQQSFTTRDYLWPIRENELLANKNTVQNPGW
ncbi:RagB/SusD family nutrient uptake outer membrane protein [Albibacterium indicum]|uniref:RagB/SusD family nutrient uptake outer membrane protein n=1 Tax=Albibacterium indicum TaxID=2292082 RepID=UPI000E536A2C|nr:RagB/SusD family nutrient uptake outer membrane protein [Pedobacter indicus]